MALSESQRLDLFDRIRRTSLGEEGTRVVMDAIPNIGWEDLATHADLGLLRGDLRLEMSELRAEMSELRGEFRSEIAGLETRLQRSMITWIIGAQGSHWPRSAFSSPF